MGAASQRRSYLAPRWERPVRRLLTLRSTTVCGLRVSYCLLHRGRIPLGLGVCEQLGRKGYVGGGPRRWDLHSSQTSSVNPAPALNTCACADSSCTAADGVRARSWAADQCGLPRRSLRRSPPSLLCVPRLCTTERAYASAPRPRAAPTVEQPGCGAAAPLELLPSGPRRRPRPSARRRQRPRPKARPATRPATGPAKKPTHPASSAAPSAFSPRARRGPPPPATAARRRRRTGSGAATPGGRPPPLAPRATRTPQTRPRTRACPGGRCAGRHGSAAARRRARGAVPQRKSEKHLRLSPPRTPPLLSFPARTTTVPALRQRRKSRRVSLSGCGWSRASPGPSPGPPPGPPPAPGWCSMCISSATTSPAGRSYPGPEASHSACTSPKKAATTARVTPPPPPRCGGGAPASSTRNR